MKKIEKPFAASAAARLAQAETAYEIAHKRYSDLKLVRDKLASGHLTPDLYNFINADGSLENLFPGLPRPSDVACEALSATQLEILDATIAEEALELKKLLEAMWEAIKDWWMDWWDRNRFLKRHLQYLQAQLKINPGIFGDDTTFSATQVNMYTNTDWYKLVNACRGLNEVCNKLSESTPENLGGVVESAKISCSTHLKEFGKYVDENGVIRQGQPNYARRVNSCATLRWRLHEVKDYLSDAIAVMEDDINIRRQFSKLEKLFKSGNPTDRNAFVFAKRLIFTSKENDLHIGRVLRVMLNKVIRDRATEYRINRPL